MARVRYDGGSGLTSAFVTAQGIGAVAGALLVPGLAARFTSHRVLMAGLLALPTTLVLYGQSPTPRWAMLALVGVGAAYICVFSGLGTVVQLRAPMHLRARVISLYFLGLGVLYPIGATIQGPIADRLGLGRVTAGSAVLFLAFLVVVRLGWPDQLRALDDVDRFPSPLEGQLGREVTPTSAPG
jgi:predicted MFS family arabinose efflux permease